jgi:hypothetical protein
MKDLDPIENSEPTGHSQHSRVQSKRKHRTVSHHPEDTSAGPQIIARIPRLPRNEQRPTPEKSSGGRQGRLLGARLSGWTLVGGVGFLILAALSPFAMSKLFSHKSTSQPTTQETAQRPEAPAPDSPDAPRWNGASASSNTWQTGNGSSLTLPGSEFRPGSMAAGNSTSPAAGFGRGGITSRTAGPGLSPSETPVVAVPATDSPVVAAIPNGFGQAAPNATLQPAGAVPWQPVPGARRPDSSADAWQPVPGARRPDSLADGAVGALPMLENRAGVDYYRPPSRGGLVNAMSSTPRDNYRDNYPAEPRPDYRTATRPRYAQDAGPSGLDDRRMSYPEAQPSTTYPGARARGSEIARDGWPSSTGAMSANPGDGNPYRASPPSWATPPTWATPPSWSSPQTSPPANYNAPSYPATGYTAVENWPSGDMAGGAGPQGVAPPDGFQAARFEGNIEKPTARNSYERTGPSFR